MRIIKLSIIMTLILLNGIAIQATTGNVSVNNTISNNITISEEVIVSDELQAESKTFSIQNEFIKVIVNNMKKSKFAALGRFAIETVLGDPQNPKDDNQSLIYGRPYPWTSYTTIYIDGKPYIFGGRSQRIQKRTGQQLKFGKVVSQEVVTKGIVTKCDFNDIRVIQTLSLLRNPSTKVKDTILISYQIINKGSMKHNVGIRLMLDTKLGSNDGSPFRIGTRSVISEEKFFGKTLFDYWQTFDSLTSPNVIAQGTIRLPEEKIYPPNRMYLVNWGTLADFAWNFDYKLGRSFIRAGEIEKDTALALYWDPVEIAPKRTRTVKTIYGLGGVTLAPGELSLGLTAPAEVYSSSKKAILVMGYILNSGGFDSKNTIATFKIPSEFKVISGKLKHNIGLLRSGEVKQIPIKIVLKKRKTGKRKIGIKISSDTLEANEIYRDIEILAPPFVSAVFQAPKKQLVKYNHFINATLVLQNKTKHVIQNLFASISPGKNLVIPAFEARKKEIINLLPNEKRKINWKLKMKNPRITESTLTAKVSSSLAPTKKYYAKTTLSRPRQVVKVIPSRKKIKKGEYFFIDCFIDNPRVFKNLDLSFSYNNNILEYNRISIAPWIKKTKQGQKISEELNHVMISGLENSKENYDLKICKIHFQAVKPGITEILIKRNNKIIKILSLNIQ